MKRFIATSAAAILTTSAAFAGAHSGMFVSKADNVQLLGSELIGSYVYVSEQEIEENFVYEDGAEQEWDNVGDINDIVLSRDGKLEAVVIGVGGFIGIGEKDVAVKMDSLRFVSDGEDSDEYFVVFNSTEEALEGAPEWNDNDRSDRARERTAEREQARTERMAYRADMDAVNDVERDGYEMVKATEVKASNLIGTRIYGTKDEDVGEVSDIVMSDDGKAKEALVDIGGFLGMGEKTVSLPMKEMKIMRKSDDEDDLRIYVDASQERLEKMTEYKD